MGRVKLQIKRIENNTNRQVTYSKRRNGLIKKAYELSVLCGVDVALIMFSPSGRLSFFSGDKSIEEILERFVELPEHERGRLHNQELLRRTLRKLRDEASSTHQVSSPVSSDSQLEDLQQKLARCKSQLEDMEKRLRIYEGNFVETATLCEVEYQEQVLGEALRHILTRKQVLKGHCPHQRPNSQVHVPVVVAAEENGFASVNPSILGILQHGDSPVQNIVNSSDTKGLLPLRDQWQSGLGVFPPVSKLIPEQNNNLGHEMYLSSVIEDQRNTEYHGQFGQIIDATFSSWMDGFCRTDTEKG